ncbi:restriction endonuclease subunit S [Bifidobacterium ramosum]|nr:restriction endonuclease subunit S [Bifidobacterium ramosum]
MTWRSMALGEAITLKRGYDLPSKKRVKGKVPVYSSSGRSGVHNEAAVHGPGVITGRYGTIGEVFYATDNYWPLNTTLYVSDFKGNYPHFIYYLLKTINWNNYTTASAVPGINRNHVHHCVVTIPDLTTQHKIAYVLGTYDQQIDCLTRTNGHLRELLKIEFANRFENEDTPVIKLGDVASIWKKSVKPANDPDKYWEHYSIPAFDAEQYPSFDLGNTIKSNKYEVVPNSVLVSKLNPTTQRLWLPQLINADSAICSTEFIEYVPSNKKDYSFYCSALMQDRFFGYLEGHVTGSTGSRQRVHPGDTLAYAVPNPCASEIRDYCMFADPVIKQIRNTSIELKRLETLRSALLPKLMSGEIDVSKIKLYTPPYQTVHANGRLSD